MCTQYTHLQISIHAHTHVPTGPLLYPVHKADPALGKGGNWVANGEVIYGTPAVLVAGVWRCEMSEVKATGKLFMVFYSKKKKKKGFTVSVVKCCPRWLTCVAVAEFQCDVSEWLKASFPQVVTSCVFLMYQIPMGGIYAAEMLSACSCSRSQEELFLNRYWACDFKYLLIFQVGQSEFDLAS